MSAEGERKNDHGCAAYGCPLPGVHRGFGTGDGWWCFVHSSPCDLQRTTAEINARAPLFRLALRASNMPGYRWAGEDVQRYISGLLTHYGRCDLLPTAEERERGPVTWAYRLRSALRREVTVARETELDREVSASSGIGAAAIGEFYSGLAT